MLTSVVSRGSGKDGAWRRDRARSCCTALESLLEVICRRFLSKYCYRGVQSHCTHLGGILLKCMLDGHNDDVVTMVAVRCTMANSTSVIGVHSGGLHMQLLALKRCARWRQLGRNDFSYII